MHGGRHIFQLRRKGVELSLRRVRSGGGGGEAAVEWGNGDTVRRWVMDGVERNSVRVVGDKGRLEVVVAMAEGVTVVEPGFYMVGICVFIDLEVV